MNFNRNRKARRHGANAFTMVEVLAAMFFMAIVIPVAVEGLRVANRAGVAAARKAVAARIAERLLNQAVLANQYPQSTQGQVGNGAVQNGVENERDTQFQWTVRNVAWDQNTVNANGLTPTVPVHISAMATTGTSGSSTQAGATSVAITDNNVLREISVEVFYQVQNQRYSVLLSTLTADLSQ